MYTHVQELGNEDSDDDQPGLHGNSRGTSSGSSNKKRLPLCSMDVLSSWYRESFEAMSRQVRAYSPAGTQGAQKISHGSCSTSIDCDLITTIKLEDFAVGWMYQSIYYQINFSCVCIVRMATGRLLLYKYFSALVITSESQSCGDNHRRL